MLSSSGGTARELTALNSLTDGVSVTYYPLDSSFQVRPPTRVRRDFDRLAEAYPRRPILVLEAGYPSGKGNKSSKAKQRKFVKRLFAAWDRHPDQIV
ncbi:MAG: hypothetical protein GY769_18785 [bacterium]|nr:hypothetical protein [bacterium]